MVILKPSFLVDIGVDLVTLILFIGILLTWIPRMPYNKEPFKWIISFCEMFFRPFRGLIPPIYGFDFSPMLALIILQVLGNIICEILYKFGL